jgi:hypothetical protein
MSIETMPISDDAIGPCDAISPLDHSNFVRCFLRIATDGSVHDGEADRDTAAKPFDETKTV